MSYPAPFYTLKKYHIDKFNTAIIISYTKMKLYCVYVNRDQIATYSTFSDAFKKVKELCLNG